MNTVKCQKNLIHLNTVAPQKQDRQIVPTSRYTAPKVFQLVSHLPQEYHPSLTPDQNRPQGQ